MSREIKRVPLDFDWPLDKVWGGYVAPDSLRGADCMACGATGFSPTARWLSETFYGHGHREGDAASWHNKITQAEVDVLVERGRYRDMTNPTAEQVNGPGLRAHDAINRHILIEWRCGALGEPYLCRACDGHASVEVYPGQRAEAEAWQPLEPPTGDGWQVWETVSEGSPISPVFDTAEALVDFLVDVGVWRKRYSREAATRFVEGGFSLGSFIVRDGQVIDGIEALS